MTSLRTPPAAPPAVPTVSRPSAQGTARLSRELVFFLAIGGAGLVGQPLLYWLLRSWWPPIGANLVSLLAVAVLNTEANRRVTFRGSGAPPGRAHLVAGVLFVFSYTITSTAVLWWRHLVPNASTASETLVLAGSSGAFTAVRFMVLRQAVFHRGRSRTS